MAREIPYAVVVVALSAVLGCGGDDSEEAPGAGDDPTDVADNGGDPVGADPAEPESNADPSGDETDDSLDPGDAADGACDLEVTVNYAGPATQSRLIAAALTELPAENAPQAVWSTDPPVSYPLVFVLEEVDDGVTLAVQITIDNAEQEYIIRDPEDLVGASDFFTVDCSDPQPVALTIQNNYGGCGGDVGTSADADGARCSGSGEICREVDGGTVCALDCTSDGDCGISTANDSMQGSCVDDTCVITCADASECPNTGSDCGSRGFCLSPED